MGHGAKQAAYLDWKVSLLENIPHARTSNAKGSVFADFTPLPELSELPDAVYFGDGQKHLTWDYLKSLTPLAWRSGTWMTAVLLSARRASRSAPPAARAGSRSVSRR